MNRVLWTLCCVFVFSLTACNEPEKNNRPEKNVEVVIEGLGPGPEFLAGIWTADRGGWKFVFEKDGSIGGIIHTMGRAALRPGQITKVPLKKGGKGYYEPGTWRIVYDSDLSELTVEIELKSFKAQIGKNIVEGNSTDIFVGPISIDGRQWDAQWYSYPEYYVTIGEYDHHKLPMDPNENPKGVLIFSKQDKPK